jgi:predicted PurR-regulated permease PerM
MNQAPQTQRRAFLLFLLGLLTLFVFILRPFLVPLLLGGVLVLLFYPLYNWFLKFFRGHRYPASFCATFVVTVFLFLPGGLIVSLVVNQLLGMVDQVTQFVEKGQMVELLKNWNLHLQDYITQIEETFHIHVNLKAMAANTVKQFALYVYQYSPGVLAQTVTFFFQGFLMVIVVFFLFVEGKGLYNEIVVLSPMKMSHENALALEMKNMIYAVVYGSFVTAMVQGFLAGIAFYFLGIKGYLVWGSLTFLFSFIPILGAASVWVPATAILFLLGEVKSAVFLIFYGALVISGIDNVLKPLLMRGKSRLHPLLLFLSIMGGLLFAGPIGILLGPITLAVFLAALRIYKKEYLLAGKG